MTNDEIFACTTFMSAILYLLRGCCSAEEQILQQTNKLNSTRRTILVCKLSQNVNFDGF